MPTFTQQNLNNSSPQATQTVIPSAAPIATNTGPAPTPAPAPAAQVVATPPPAPGVMDFVKKHKKYFIGGGILLLILISIYIYRRTQSN